MKGTAALFAEAISKNNETAGKDTPSGGPAATVDQTTDKNTDEKAGQQQAGQPAEQQQQDDKGGTQPKPGEQFSLSKIFKERTGLDLSDEDILARVKGEGALGPAASQNQPSQPKNPEVTDDEVIGALEKSGITRDQYNRAKELKAKSDFEVVKLTWAPEIKAVNPTATDEEIDQLLKEKYFISESEGVYDAHEIAIGEKLLKAEADRIREKEGSPVESVRNTLLNGKAAAMQREQFQASVEQFLPTVPKDFNVKIGKRGNVDLGEFNFPVAPEIHQKVGEIIKTPDAIGKYLSGPDGKTDLKKLYNLFLNNEIINSLGATIADHYHSMGVEKVSGKVNAYPNLNKTTDNGGAADQKKAAEEHNRQAVESNIGRRRG